VALALLIGAIVGRTMPALLIAVVVFAGWGLVVVPRAQAMLADQRAVWQGGDAWLEGGSYLPWMDQGNFDQTRPGRPGEPGARVDENAWGMHVQEQIEEACGPSPEGDDPDYDYESPEYQTYSNCAQPFWDQQPTEEYAQWELVVPRSAWGDFMVLDVLMSVALGAGALLLTIVVVAVRRPE
jgi:hypothetical protein